MQFILVVLNYNYALKLFSTFYVPKLMTPLFKNQYFNIKWIKYIVSN